MTTAVAAAQTCAAGDAPGRDFDGGLLLRLTYRLGTANALASLHLKRELAGWQKRALGRWCVLGGAFYGPLADSPYYFEA